MTMLAEATDGTWNIELVEETTNQTWKLELRNLGRFDEVFDRRVLNAFCRCFVHVNRLNSMISCMYTSEQYHGRQSVAYARDLNTLMWFTVGTLRELARAIQHLRSALATCDRLDPESAPGSHCVTSKDDGTTTSIGGCGTRLRSTLMKK